MDRPELTMSLALCHALGIHVDILVSICGFNRLSVCGQCSESTHSPQPKGLLLLLLFLKRLRYIF